MLQGSVPPCRRAIRALSRSARTPTRPRCSPARTALRERLVQEMRGRIKEDDSSVPDAGRPVRLFHAATARAASTRSICRRATGGRRGDDPARRRPRGGGPAVLRSGRRRPFAGPPPPGLERRPEGLGVLHHPGPRSRDAAQDLRGRRSPSTSGERRLDSAIPRGFYYVELDENHRPVRVKRHRLGTPAAERRASSTRRRIPACSSNVGADPVRRLRPHRGERPRDLRSPPARPARPRRPSAARRAARRRAAIRVEHHGERPHHPHQRRRRRGFQDRHGAGRRPRAAPHWRDLVPASAGRHDPVRTWRSPRYLVRLEREDAQAAHRRARDSRPAREQTIAFAEEAYSLGIDAGYEYDTDVDALSATRR